MSKYTTEVRFICETIAKNNNPDIDLNNVQTVIDSSRTGVFNFTYPIFDETYRPVLESKILRHYYTREISEETVALWKLRLQDKLNIIMPYYNKLYESEKLMFNPLQDTNLTRNRSGDRNEEGSKSETTSTENKERGGELSTRKGDTKSSSDTTGVNTRKGDNKSSDETTNVNTRKGVDVETATHTDDEWNLYSDTPQGGIAGIQGAGSITDPSLSSNAFLTNARHVMDTKNDNTRNESDNMEQGHVINKADSETNEMTQGHTVNKVDAENNEMSQRIGNREGEFSGETTGEHSISTTESYLESISGKTGGRTYSQMLKEFRETFLNIDRMIINELSSLFFGLW